MGIPACLWRRTGEIYKGNKEFALLIGVPVDMLREGRLCIYEVNMMLFNHSLQRKILLNIFLLIF